jgi:hypothetical protein
MTWTAALTGPHPLARPDAVPPPPPARPRLAPGTPCAWCRDADATTWDHFVPACRGGRLVVPACEPCNQSRGRVTSAFGMLLSLAARIRVDDAKARRRARSEARRYVEAVDWPAEMRHRDGWAELETELYGRSPTADVPLASALHVCRELAFRGDRE